VERTHSSKTEGSICFGGAGGVFFDDVQKFPDPFILVFLVVQVNVPFGVFPADGDGHQVFYIVPNGRDAKIIDKEMKAQPVSLMEPCVEAHIGVFLQVSPVQLFDLPDPGVKTYRVGACNNGITPQLGKGDSVSVRQGMIGHDADIQLLMVQKFLHIAVILGNIPIVIHRNIRSTGFDHRPQLVVLHQDRIEVDAVHAGAVAGNQRIVDTSDVKKLIRVALFSREKKKRALLKPLPGSKFQADRSSIFAKTRLNTKKTTEFLEFFVSKKSNLKISTKFYEK